MTEQERRFKVKKIDKYEEQVTKQNRNSYLFALASGAGALLLVVGTTYGAAEGINLFWKTFDVGLSVVGAGTFGLNLKHLLDAMSRKTTLESKIDDIQDELDFEEEQEKEGKSL